MESILCGMALMSEYQNATWDDYICAIQIFREQANIAWKSDKP
jgi:hypothetical protein